MLIDPERLPRLPVAFMNQDHADEARLLNAAGGAVEAYRAGGAAKDQVKAALEALYVHTRAHFAREESAMVDASFPAYSFHQAEHVRILGELGALACEDTRHTRKVFERHGIRAPSTLFSYRELQAYVREILSQRESVA